MRNVFLAGLAALGATAAQAGDVRILSHRYNPEEILRLDGRAGVQASVAFEEDELIENVAVGDSNAWQITPNKKANILFVKPLSLRAHTNMTVITNHRTYLFDLVAGGRGIPVYLLRFTYAADAKARSASQAKLDAAGPGTGQPGNARPTPAEELAERNFAWRKTGSRKIMPSQIYDDGTATFVTWAAGTPIPAILVENERGEEGPVNFAVRGDLIVIEGVPKQIVLRSSKDRAVIQHSKGQLAKGGADGPAAIPTALTQGF